MHDLDPAEIQRALSGRSYGRSLEVKARTGSTNDDVRDAAAAGAASGHVIVADAQDRGRGGHGRRWSSPGGTDLYFSILERRTLSSERLPWLTLAVGLGVRDAVAARLAGPVRCKWPNDVLVDDRKCAGILVESSSTGGAVGPFVIGVGIDVNRADFSEELEPIATSLRRSGGVPLDRGALLAAVLGAIEARVDQLHAGDTEGLARDLSEHLAWVGAEVRVDETVGTLEGLAPDGALRLRTASGIALVRAGTLRRA